MAPPDQPLADGGTAGVQSDDARDKEGALNIVIAA